MKPFPLAVFSAGFLLGIGCAVLWIRPSLIHAGRGIEADGNVANKANQIAGAISKSSEPAAGSPESAPTAEAKGFSTRLREILRQGNQRKRGIALDHLAEGMNPSGIRKALAELNALKGSFPEKDRIVIQLLTQWAESDVKGALAYAQGLKGDDRRWAVSTIVGVWAEHDSTAAERWASELPAGLIKTETYQGIISQLTQSDPEHALTLALEQKSSQVEAESSIGKVFDQLAARDPRSAVNRANSLPGIFRNIAWQHIASVWAGSDVNSALQFANSLPKGDNRKEIVSDIVSIWADQDVDAAMRYVNAIPDHRIKANLLECIASKVVEKDPRRAISIIQMMPGDYQDGMLRDVAYHWVRDDQQAALAWAQQQTDEHVKKAIMPTIVSEMVQNDPKTALAFALTIQAGDARDNAIGSVAYRLADSDPQTALACTLTMSSPASKYMNVLHIAQAWARNDPAGVTVWADQQTDVQIKSAVLPVVILEKASSEPQAAAALLQTLPAGEGRDFAIYQFSLQWARNDPTAAIAWAAQLPKNSERKTAMVNVACEWANNDLSAATVWVKSLPEGGTKDSMLSQGSDSIKRTNPAAAVQWASGIGDNEKRSAQLANLAQDWLQEDETAAIQWIRNSSLPDEVKARLLQRKQQQ